MLASLHSLVQLGGPAAPAAAVRGKSVEEARIISIRSERIAEIEAEIEAERAGGLHG